MSVGTITTTVRDRGFGFIADPAGNTWFFHRADLVEGTDFADLAEGDEVSFEPVFPQPPKGPRATNVRQVVVVSEPAAPSGQPVGR